jgi:predicted GIY-YIG superfamily endonuclease
MPPNLPADDRLTLIAHMREEARVVAAVGHWPAPGVFWLYWAVNTVNWKVYIGVTNDFLRRVADHRNDAANGSLLPIHRAVQKNGPCAFVFVPIEDFADEATMLRAEKQALGYVPHVQPAFQFLPVIPGPATGAGGGGLLT